MQLKIVHIWIVALALSIELQLTYLKNVKYNRSCQNSGKTVSPLRFETSETSNVVQM